MEQTSENALVQNAEKTLLDFMKKYEKSIVKVLPASLNPQRISWLLINAVRLNPNLLGVTPVSFLNAAMLASNLGLEIRARSAYLIPYGKECQLLIDYRGKLTLAARSGVIIHPPVLVLPDDEFKCEYDETGIKFKHVPTWGDGVPTHGWVAATVNGQRIVHVMSIAQIDKSRQRAKAGCAKPFRKFNKDFPGLTVAEIYEASNGERELDGVYRQPWVTDYPMMAAKTLVHKIFDRLPQDSTMALSQEIDDAMEQNKPMPQVLEPEMLIDPADNLPMVDDGGDTYAEKKATQARVRDAKLAAMPKLIAEEQHA